MRSYALYQGPVIQAVVSLKYRPNRRLGSLMAQWLFEVINRTRWRVDAVVAVPLARDRFRHRGYNQTQLIAEPLAALLGCPIVPDALKRVRATRSQVGLDPLGRSENLRGAFVASGKAVCGLKMLVVDDLITSGATMRACAKALLAAGAEGVYGLSVARAC
jgi:ComF family protein